MLVAVGACAINGGLPAQRNHLDLRDILEEVYQTEYLLRPRRHTQRPGTAAAAGQGAPDPRSGEGGLLPARLPAARRRDSGNC
jgi:hypothetical protein